MIIIEYMENGSLDAFLRVRINHPRQSGQRTQYLFCSVHYTRSSGCAAEMRSQWC